MPFDWTEYLNLAKALRANAPSTAAPEAVDRCVVSKAYFAAFCYARNYARDKHKFSVTQQVEDHRLLRDHYRGRSMGAIAMKLDDLRKWRNLCDYRDDVENLPKLASNAISAAQKIVDTLN